MVAEAVEYDREIVSRLRKPPRDRTQFPGFVASFTLLQAMPGVDPPDPVLDGSI
jgi:hypothetical protein